MINILYERHLMKNPALPFSFHTDTIKPPRDFYPNWHDNPEFLHCIDGDGEVYIDNSPIKMKKGDTVIINPRRLHATKTNQKMVYHCLIVDEQFFKDNGIDIDKIYFLDKISDPKAKELMENIAHAFKRKWTDFSVPKIRLCVLEYIYYISKNFSNESKQKAKKISKSYAAVLDSIEYISNHYKEPLSLDEISARAGFSRFHFSRLFKENTGSTMIELLNAKRCEAAAILIRNTSMSISEICFECGYDSPSYFAKTFNKIYGHLPSDYRKIHSNT